MQVRAFERHIPRTQGINVCYWSNLRPGLCYCFVCLFVCLFSAACKTMSSFRSFLFVDINGSFRM